MKNSKAPGLENITSDMLKNGGECLIESLTSLLNNCWLQQLVPEEWKKGMIVKIPKKASLSNCNNWRGITLLSIPGKVLSIILLNSLKDSIELKLKEQQTGFRSNRFCSEQIFTLRKIIEQCIEFQQPILLNFLNFKKAFDSIHRESLWKIAVLYVSHKNTSNYQKHILK